VTRITDAKVKPPRIHPMNTAQLRKMARAAADACNWSEAARLYKAAADAYGPYKGSQLAERDVAQLLANAVECARAAS
jgi:hypothetical protein